jgi:hypothetical protein
LGISRRFPGRKEIAQVYAVIVLLIYSWTIIRFLLVFPTWRRHLTAGEINGALANGLAINLLESALVLGVLVLVAACLPEPWFRGAFVARGTVLAISTLAYMWFLGDQLKLQGMFPALSLPGWALILPLPGIIALSYLAGRWSAPRRALQVFAENATIFLYIMPPLSLIAVMVILLRALP